MTSFKNVMPVALKVLSDWHVIFIIIFSIFVLSLINWVVKYKKRPPRAKKPVAAAPVKQEEKASEKQESAEK